MTEFFTIQTALAQENEHSLESSASEVQAAEAHSEGLSIDPYQVGFHIFNFLILLVVLKLILYKPLLKLLKEREQRIKEGVENAEKADVMVKESHLIRQDILKNAKIESQNVLEEGRKAAEDMKASILEQAHLESDKIVAAGHESIQRQQLQITQELQQKAVSLIIKVAEKVLKEKIDASKDRDLIQESIKRYSV